MTVGTELSVKAVREKKCALLLISCDASDNTVKRITNASAYYGVRCETLKQSSEELAHLVGKSGCVAVVGITDERFSAAILKSMKGQGESDI